MLLALICSEDYYRKLAQKIRKSTYFKMFPVLEVDCWPLDGNYKNTPIIFEERYRTVRSTPTSEEGKRMLCLKTKAVVPQTWH